MVLWSFQNKTCHTSEERTRCAQHPLHFNKSLNLHPSPACIILVEFLVVVKINTTDATASVLALALVLLVPILFIRFNLSLTYSRGGVGV
jgi:hypothetical protein